MRRILLTLALILMLAATVQAAPLVTIIGVENTTATPGTTHTLEVHLRNNGDSSADTSIVFTDLPSGIQVVWKEGVKYIPSGWNATIKARLSIAENVTPGEYTFQVYDNTPMDSYTYHNITLNIVSPTTPTPTETPPATETPIQAPPEQDLLDTPAPGAIVALSALGIASLLRRR